MIASTKVVPDDVEARVSPAVEDFLRALADLGGANRTVATSRLAAALGIRDPSVTTMAKRLHATGLIDHTPYHGLRLTLAGGQVAGGVVRRHQLLERALATTLGLTPDEAHTEAEHLEHAVGPSLEARLRTIAHCSG